TERWATGSRKGAEFKMPVLGWNGGNGGRGERARPGIFGLDRVLSSPARRRRVFSGLAPPGGAAHRREWTGEGHIAATARVERIPATGGEALARGSCAHVRAVRRLLRIHSARGHP